MKGVTPGVIFVVLKSILWPDGENVKIAAGDPDFFKDLNISNIVDGIISGNDDYNLRPIFRTIPKSVDTVIYRQEIFKDLQNPEVLEILKNFSASMRTVYRRLSGIENLNEYQKQGWFLDASLLYLETMEYLEGNLKNANLASIGLKAFRDYIHEYVNSPSFREEYAEARRVKANLSSIRYELTIVPSKVTVRRDKGKENYNEIVRQAFSKFRENRMNAEKLSQFSDYSMNIVETEVLVLLARLFPKEFGELRSFFENHKNIIDPVVALIYTELQFYILYLEYISPLIKIGLEFCIPEITSEKDVYCFGSFDLALAQKKASSGSTVVSNDFELSEGENVIVVTGPNNGGKTTFSRAFGQAFFLASLGLPVPGRKARLFLVDNIYTHFEKSEEPENLRGKLEDDLMRIKKILDSATEKSVIIINEMLGSTSLNDAILIGKRIIELIRRKKSICVYVTFFDELAKVQGVVSMVAQVDPSAPELKTFKVIRSEPNGLAYARAIAEKYGLTYDQILRRIKG